MDDKVAELQLEVEQLQQQLQEKDNDVQSAVDVGKFLLEENSKLKDKIESTVKECTEKIETLQQENYIIQQKLDAKTASENWFNTELAHYKEGFQKENEKLKENLETEKQQEVSKLQRKIDDLQLELETSQRTEKDLQSQIQQLEELVQQGLEHTEVISKSFLNDEIGELKTELVDFKNENTNLKSQLIEEKSQYQKVKTEVDGLRNKVFAKESELEEIQCQAMSYFSSLENARTEILDLKTEMEALRMESSVHSKKGNSLFSELEDRRVDAEKKLVSLKVQFDAVKDKYEFEKQQNHKLKMQMVVLFQKSKGTADTERLRQLESHLSRERAENQELLLQIQKLKKSSEVIQTELLNKPQTQGDKEVDGKKFDENYVNYLRTIIKEKE
ncbi:hypothetical protein KUTeg_001424 [Tegillarca granosa]|uniref:Uncharacterized protein n=1 Tax=Tegillarca granosa TaxID=220873 RepID=A0ABQ9FRD6_TEGGR|nr:hypothetical protein KUTeg_001424 [Tegillarca granosa]